MVSQLVGSLSHPSEEFSTPLKVSILLILGGKPLPPAGALGAIRLKGAPPFGFCRGISRSLTRSRKLPLPGAVDQGPLTVANSQRRGAPLRPPPGRGFAPAFPSREGLGHRS